ncbi:NlpC/P60 family protein [Streptomyces sp. SL13]|jgi:cell wall-associated NlpC family hydrolase|uniref:NlpC/P60 family protein n=1 Tax=Streptantibioticus silvisoli TaxID=2705255 RepID=A0AA90H953_9ACTN|nr:NlpC/P60 family protein [Streptantibioticus silvisoli]MDI5973405.1 NlpC/P60 family protein [Streptantibioticus silvisoli]
MPAPISTSQRSPWQLRRAGTTAFLTAALAGSLLTPGLAPPADAAAVAARALHVAAAQSGAPYQWGASGPYRFDCSGLTFYAFRAAGRRLPRTAAAQYARSRHISAASRTPGDLVFFHTGRYVYHVGFYAGHNKIWHAPHTGARVRLERIWTHAVWYGRIA